MRQRLRPLPSLSPPASWTPQGCSAPGEENLEAPSSVRWLLQPPLVTFTPDVDFLFVSKAPLIDAHGHPQVETHGSIPLCPFADEAQGSSLSHSSGARSGCPDSEDVFALSQARNIKGGFLWADRPAGSQRFQEGNSTKTSLNDVSSVPASTQLQSYVPTVNTKYLLSPVPFGKTTPV